MLDGQNVVEQVLLDLKPTILNIICHLDDLSFCKKSSHAKVSAQSELDFYLLFEGYNYQSRKRKLLLAVP